MNVYLGIAEIVYKKLKAKNFFMVDPTHDFDILIKYIQYNLNGSNLQLKYRNLTLDKIIAITEKDSLIVDISIIPKMSNKEEFILWLALLLEKITYKTNQDISTISFSNNKPIKLPDYTLKEESKECLDISNKIEQYFKKLKL